MIVTIIIFAALMAGASVIRSEWWAEGYGTRTFWPRFKRTRKCIKAAFIADEARMRYLSGQRHAAKPWPPPSLYEYWKARTDRQQTVPSYNYVKLVDNYVLTGDQATLDMAVSYTHEDGEPRGFVKHYESETQASPSPLFGCYCSECQLPIKARAALSPEDYQAMKARWMSTYGHSADPTDPP